MVDETTDISNVAQMSYVLRYSTDGGVNERLFKFEDITEDKRAEPVAVRIISFLEECECTVKVVAVLRWGRWTIRGRRKIRFHLRGHCE